MSNWRGSSRGSRNWDGVKGIRISDIGKGLVLVTKGLYAWFVSWGFFFESSVISLFIPFGVVMEIS